MTVKALSRQLYRTLMLVVLIQVCASWLGAQSTLQITSPSDGAVFSPGQTITVTVTTSGSGFSSVFVIGEDVLGISPLLSAPPYQFSLPIPASAVPDQYAITAAGVITGDEPVYSSPVTIKVQRPDVPAKVQVEPDILALKAGQKGYLRVIATYTDGSTANITKASNTIYISDSKAVATVNSYGIVTAVASGSARILINGGRALVHVTVAPAMKIAPPRKVLYPSQNQQFFPTLADSSVPSVAWSLNPGNIGTINASGIYTAPPVFTTPQTVIVTATSTLDGVTSATATVNFIGRPVATPAFSPPAGTYTSTQSVTISTTTSGASIRYTADGSTPSSTVGTLYSSPVSISTSTTLKAVGYETGMSDSLVVSGLYGIVPPIVRPIF